MGDTKMRLPLDEVLERLSATPEWIAAPDLVQGIKAATAATVVLKAGARDSAGEPALSPHPRSHFGGSPLLGRGTSWPSRADGRPLSFLCQIDLAEVPRDHFEAEAAILGLPSSGLLAFFYDVENQPWGGDDGDFDGHAVIYTPADIGASERTAPEGAPQGSEFAPMLFHADRAIDRDVLTDERYYDLVEGSEDLIASAAAHHLGGIPDPIQGDPRLEAPDQEKDWTLLLQLESEDRLGWLWGDAGCLYFMVPSAKLAHGDLSENFLSLQCY